MKIFREKIIITKQNKIAKSESDWLKSVDKLIAFKMSCGISLVKFVLFVFNLLCAVSKMNHLVFYQVKNKEKHEKKSLKENPKLKTFDNGFVNRNWWNGYCKFGFLGAKLDAEHSGQYSSISKYERH